ncbi:hypothetical protein LIX17_25245 (plasmid) [Mycobacterium avium subsp. hominissuis]|uniref:hypothetical protein n=1 Tax=Mycobacterium avium TaxID=1764 RepID=UPI0031403405
MTVLGERPTASAPHTETTQVIVVHDLQEGDYLPDYGSTVRGVEICTERLGIGWVDVLLEDQRRLVLHGYGDIASDRSTVAPTRSPRR